MQKSLLYLAFYLFTSAILNAQQEQVIVEGGIETDSLYIRNLPAVRAITTADAFISNSAQEMSSHWQDDGSASNLSTFDNDNNFDSSTGVFTAPRKGLYKVEMTAIFKCLRFFDENLIYYIAINDNITDNCIIGSDVLNNTNNQNFSISKHINSILMLDEGDELSIYTHHTNGTSSQNTYSVFLTAQTSFSVYLITDVD